MNRESALRKELVVLLRGGNAHMDFEEAVRRFPEKYLNMTMPGTTRPPDVPLNPWHVLEHMRVVQWDILEFIRDPGHVSPDYPEGYWPAPEEQATSGRWKKTVDSFRADLKALEDIALDPARDLLSPIPHAKDYILVREILLAADHNAYHLGQFALFRDIAGEEKRGSRAKAKSR
jgi:hypothetical protein